MKKIIALAFASQVFAAWSVPRGFTDDLDAALKSAGDRGHSVVAVFTGSDWCKGCRRLEESVLSKDEFLAEATNGFELVYIDSPRDRKSLSETAMRNNPMLVRRYGVNAFPTVLVLNAQGVVLGKTKSFSDGPAEFVGKLKEIVAGAPLVKQHLGPFKDEFEALNKEGTDKMREAMEKLMAGESGDKQAGEKSLWKAFKGVADALLPRYEGLIERLKVGQVAEVEAARRELLSEVEEAVRQMKMMLAAKERLDNGDDDGPCVRRSASEIAVPAPGTGRVETDYYDRVSMPFYRKHVVEGLQIPAGMNAEDAARLRVVREALARWLATGRDCFPTGSECETADYLWNRAGCRDAAVAILHYQSLDPGMRYWEGKRCFQESCARHDFDREPVLGFVLRMHALACGQYRKARGRLSDDGEVAAPRAASIESYRRIADVFKSEDRRIFERFVFTHPVPEPILEDFGDEYLTRCCRAADCLNLAFEARGGGLASEVTEEGWKGFDANWREAESNLLAAAALRPEEARPATGLAELYGCSCGSGDAVGWFNAAVSNSLDQAEAGSVGFLHFQTSRWGAPCGRLLDILMACATNVDVRSAFAYRTAAKALNKIIVAETDGMSRAAAVKAVFTPELAAALYGMFDAYIKAPESPYLPSRDAFRLMAMAVAVQHRDWPRVRAYYRSIEGRLSYSDCEWIKLVANPDGIHYEEFMIAVLLNGLRVETYLEAEQAAAEGRHEDSFRIYDAVRKEPDLSPSEQGVIGRRYFEERRILQEREGGWVDAMPTEFGTESFSFWGMTRLRKDGRAGFSGGPSSEYRLEQSLPGLGVEYEATVHFETNDVKQTNWSIGWGLARQFSGYCSDSVSWAYPYIGFARNNADDFAVIESFGEDGKFAEVWSGKLERSDSHGFRLKTVGGRLVIEIDGREVYSDSLDRMLELMSYAVRFQPDGRVLPVWKLRPNTSFSGYRYRVIEKKEPRRKR